MAELIEEVKPQAVGFRKTKLLGPLAIKHSRRFHLLPISINLLREWKGVVEISRPRHARRAELRVGIERGSDNHTVVLKA